MCISAEYSNLMPVSHNTCYSIFTRMPLLLQARLKMTVSMGVLFNCFRLSVLIGKTWVVTFVLPAMATMVSLLK